MSFKSVLLAGLLVLGAFTATAQTYWSNDANLNCGAYGDSNGAPLKLDSGGYVCYVYGTLPWYASGAGWASSIRVSAPTTAPVAYFFFFSDEQGADATLDFRYQGDATVQNGTSASSALNANQPLQVDILGSHSQSGAYGTMAGGPVVVLAECPDANTCSLVQAQLLYSALPSKPWTLSAPVVWDSQTSFAWSAVGVDNGSSDTVSFVIYNLDTVGQVPHSYTFNIYDAAGSLYSTATTKPVPLFGSYADLVRSVVSKLPSGAFKLQMVGPAYSAFEALQFQGASATALVVASDTVPNPAATPNSAIGRSRRPSPAALQSARSHTAR